MSLNQSKKKNTLLQKRPLSNSKSQQPFKLQKPSSMPIQDNPPSSFDPSSIIVLSPTLSSPSPPLPLQPPPLDLNLIKPSLHLPYFPPFYFITSPATLVPPDGRFRLDQAYRLDQRIQENKFKFESEEITVIKWGYRAEYDQKVEYEKESTYYTDRAGELQEVIKEKRITPARYLTEYWTISFRKKSRSSCEDIATLHFKKSNQKIDVQCEPKNIRHQKLFADIFKTKDITRIPKIVLEL